MKTASFFNEQTEQSSVKAEIVSKYFYAWANVMISKSRQKHIAYIDLFAGRGKYDNGKKSTPLLIITEAINHPIMKDTLISILNDADKNNVKLLEAEIQKLEGIQNLKYQPRVHNDKVGAEIAASFGRIKLVPSFSFIDPWGYKGLSLQLINSVLKDWGCDCVFFFNYNRINAGINNKKVETHMQALFGEQRLCNLRLKLKNLSPRQKERIIIEETENALKEKGGGKYIVHFCFKKDTRSRTSHYLIFVSKHFRGYDIMKGVMAKASSQSFQGVATFEYCNTDKWKPTLPGLIRPLDELENSLLQDFTGQKVSIDQIYEIHSVGTKYIKTNYKDAFRNLETKGKILADIPPDKRRKHKGQVTIKDDLLFTFPSFYNRTS